MTASLFFAATIPLAWLLPNHYYPWPSAWQEGLALALLLVSATTCRDKIIVQWQWLAMAALVVCSVLLQWLGGKILFGGDALLVLLYVAAFAIALAVGHSVGRSGGAVDALAVGTLAAAVASVGVALMQWTGAVSLGIYGTNVPPGARPFANVSQPNHFCCLAFLGLCGALLLRETRRIGAVGFWAASAFMLLGMVMSASRAGWLELGTLVLAALVLRRQVSHSLTLPQLFILAGLFVGGTLLWPFVNEGLLLTGGRGVGHQIDGGARIPIWLMLLDAVRLEPWQGYGWQQMVLAQQGVALDHAPLRYHFEHSHNLVLDLLLWAGVPVAAAICGLGLWALLKLVRSMTDARALWLVVGVLGLLAYSMVEFPLEYAYFLLPAGLALGAAAALSPVPLPQVELPNWALRAAGAAGCVLLAAIAVEYLEAEQNHRLLRLESARIGTSRIESTAPDLKLLTQLGAFLSFARTEARAGMTPQQVDEMERVAKRFAYPPSMLRYALAAGLNGRADDAQQTLRRICHMHPQPRCDEAREAWLGLQRAHPALRSIPPP